MNARRRTLSAALAAVPILLLAAGEVTAHGAPTDPVSRVAACGPDGGQLRATDACRAAIAANGGAGFQAWDNLRVPGVAGRDRRVIPDGQLCSAGLDAYRGLDIPRADWPATPLRAGAEITVTYRSTIPHRGTFSLYLTEQGHDPRTPLRWRDLSARPFAAVNDPQLTDGAYRIRGRLPAGLTGRHVLYTIWRNTDTPDTYYSCSDVVLVPGDRETPQGGADSEAPAFPLPSPTPSAPAEPTPSAEPSADAETDPAAGGVAPPANPPVAAAAPRPAPASAQGDDAAPGIIAGGVAAALALVSLCGSIVLRRRRL